MPSKRRDQTRRRKADSTISGASKTAGVTKNAASPARRSRRKKTPETAMVAPKRNLMELPLEILVKIIGNLPFSDLIRVEYVSRRMRDAAQYAWKLVRGISMCSTVYRNRSQFVNNHQCTDYQIQQIAKHVIRRGNILHFEAGTPLTQFELPSDRFFEEVSPSMPNLQRITLERIFISIHDINTLSMYCRQVTHVTLNNCLDDRRSYDRSLGRLFKSCQQLGYVDLQNNQYFTGGPLRFLPSTVRHLNLYRDNQIESSTMQDIVKACPKLISLVVDVSALDIESVNVLLQGLPKVVSLGIFSAESPITPMFLNFAYNHDLEVLFLQETENVKPETFFSLSNYTKLRSLSYVFYTIGLSTSTVQSIASCRSLETLYLSGDVDLPDVRQIVNCCGVQYLRLAQYQTYPLKSINSFVRETPSLGRRHRAIKLPLGFEFDSFVDDYFSDQLQAMADTNGIINQDRPIFQVPYKRSAGYVRPSELKKSKYCPSAKNILEFGLID